MADETSVTAGGGAHGARPGCTLDTSMTARRHVTRGRLNRLWLLVGEEKLAAALAKCRDTRQQHDLIEAACLAWFGPISPRAERSDVGRFHKLPERVWSTRCRRCGGDFYASRPDAKYCSSRCRQAAYRRRKTSASKH